MLQNINIKIHKKLHVLFVVIAAFLLLSIPVYASVTSSTFLPGTQKYVNLICSQPNIGNQISINALLCYVFYKTNELNTGLSNTQNAVTSQGSQIQNLQNVVANQSSQITTLQQEVASLEATPTAQTTYVVSDATWKFSLTDPSGWLGSTFDDSAWINTQAPSDGQCSVSAITPTSLINENGTLPMSVSSPNWTGQTGYFRKTFNLSFIPSSASLKELTDDYGTVYINGNLVFSTTIGPNSGIQSATINPNVFVMGKNVINVIDVDAGGCQSTQVEVKINP